MEKRTFVIALMLLLGALVIALEVVTVCINFGVPMPHDLYLNFLTVCQIYSCIILTVCFIVWVEMRDYNKTNTKDK